MQHFLLHYYSFLLSSGALHMQGLSMLMAIILKALGPYPGRDYGSDDDFQPERLPLLKNYVPPPPRVAGDQIHGTKNDSSITRINSKVSMNLNALSDLYREEVTS